MDGLGGGAGCRSIITILYIVEMKNQDENDRIILPCRGRVTGGIRFSIIKGCPGEGHGGGFSL